MSKEEAEPPAFYLNYLDGEMHGQPHHLFTDEANATNDALWMRGALSLKEEAKQEELVIAAPKEPVDLTHCIMCDMVLGRKWRTRSTILCKRCYNKAYNENPTMAVGLKKWEKRRIRHGFEPYLSK